MAQKAFPPRGPYSPSYDFAPITPDDNDDLPAIARALFIGVGGDVEVVSAKSGAAVVFRNVPSGTTMDIGATRVRASNTTATDIVALY